MTPACGAGGPGFKSQRARHQIIKIFYALKETPLKAIQPLNEGANFFFKH
jgi:hypothetical protein